MSLDAPQPTLEKPETLVKRRGLFAAAWAAVAAAMLRQTTQPVQAGTDGDVVLGAYNATANETLIVNTAMNGTGLSAACTQGNDGVGLFAEGSSYAVLGLSLSTSSSLGAGLFGAAWNSAPYGVWGSDQTGMANVGVFGQSPNGTGVRGTSGSGVGVHGVVFSASSANTTAIIAQNSSTYAGPAPGAGGFAIYGVSAKGHSVVGAATTAGAGAVVGATNGVAGAYAGVFFGPVVVGGSFTVFGPKSAAVPHPDGTHRRLYCMESPESWFEDFGKGQLACGQADVTLDPDFAAVVNLDDYHVFLTGYGDRDLTVTEQTPTGFRVETKDAASTNRFSWRVVAKRRGIAAPRFETVEVPPEPVLPNIPEPPAAPESPHPRVGAHPRR